MLIDLLWIALGVALILWGADALTDGASAIARRLGVSEFIIGVIIVGLGTSMPELTISVMGAINNNPGLAIGNVVGSNIVNILLILGMVALASPLAVMPSVVRREAPMTVFVSALIFGMSLLPGNELTRVDGFVLLGLFILFVFYLLKSNGGNTEEPSGNAPQRRAIVSIVKIVAGLAALVFGGDKFVDGASALASRIGISDAVIGLTIAAIGTSLPELATSVVAARKGKADLALGNVVGSCILNIILILGLSAVIRPLPFGDVGTVDLAVMTGAALLLWATCRWYGNFVIKRLEGALMLACYAAYLVWLLA